MARTHNFTRRNQTEEKTDAINNLKPPTNTQTLTFFLGAIHYFAKFTLTIFEKTDNMRRPPEREKLEWTEDSNTDLNKIKQEQTTLPYLAHYNGNSKKNIVSTDAYKTGLGEALWQKNDGVSTNEAALARTTIRTCLIHELIRDATKQKAILIPIKAHHRRIPINQP